LHNTTEKIKEIKLKIMLILYIKLYFRDLIIY